MLFPARSRTRSFCACLLALAHCRGPHVQTCSSGLGRQWRVCCVHRPPTRMRARRVHARAQGMIGVKLFVAPMMASGIIFFAAQKPPPTTGFLVGTFAGTSLQSKGRARARGVAGRCVFMQHSTHVQPGTTLCEAILIHHVPMPTPHIRVSLTDIHVYR
jgi:hypothetical protein